jgi:hypothetical protein
MEDPFAGAFADSGIQPRFFPRLAPELFHARRGFPAFDQRPLRRHSQGGMNSPAHIPRLFSRASFS